MLIIYIFLTLEKSKESSDVMTTKALKLEYCYLLSMEKTVKKLQASVCDQIHNPKLASP